MSTPRRGLGRGLGSLIPTSPGKTSVLEAPAPAPDAAAGPSVAEDGTSESAEAAAEAANSVAARKAFIALHCRRLPRPELSVKQADKRDSVTALAGYDDHSSRPRVATGLEPPTRRLGGPRQRLPIWCCSA